MKILRGFILLAVSLMIVGCDNAPERARSTVSNNKSIYVVTSGDTVSLISLKTGVSVSRLVAMNNISDPNHIVVGDRLRLQLKKGETLDLKGRGQVSRGARYKRLRKQKEAMTPPSEKKGRFNPEPKVHLIWPVRGRLLARFGESQGDLHNNGINIATPQGTPIHAAAKGRVVYIGQNMRGFGKIILIKHDDDMMTAYAHAQKILVSKDDMVTQGQVIATVGQSGAVRRPQLHFEVRQHKKPIDPQLLLAP